MSSKNTKTVGEKKIKGKEEETKEETQGQGVFEFESGAKYEGQWLLSADGEKKKHGLGKLDFNGEHYLGDWNEDAITGKGKYSFVSGDCYEGEFLNGVFHGQGVYKWKTGEVYDGSWCDGKMSGYGSFIQPEGDRYQGAFYNDKYQTESGVWIWPMKKLCTPTTPTNTEK